MSTSLTNRFVRLADDLGELRMRLKEAAHIEFAEAVAEALAEAARTWICGKASLARVRRQKSAYDDPWEDRYDDPSWSHEEFVSSEAAHATKSSALPYDAALATALIAARWSLIRTGQPIAALGIASAAAIVVLFGGERLRPLVDVVTSAHELLSLPNRRQ